MGQFKRISKTDVKKQVKKRVYIAVNKELRKNAIQQLSYYISSKIIRKILRFNIVQYSLIRMGLNYKILFLFILVFV